MFVVTSGINIIWQAIERNEICEIQISTFMALVNDNIMG